MSIPTLHTTVHGRFISVAIRSGCPVGFKPLHIPYDTALVAKQVADVALSSGVESPLSGEAGVNRPAGGHPPSGNCTLTVRADPRNVAAIFDAHGTAGKPYEALGPSRILVLDRARRIEAMRRIDQVDALADDVQKVARSVITLSLVH